MKNKPLILLASTLLLASCGGQNASSGTSGFTTPSQSEPFKAHLELSGDYKTSFNVGDRFTSEGLVVTLVEEGLTTDVTEDCDVIAPSLRAGGTQTVTVIYGDFSVEYAIEVTDQKFPRFNVTLGEIFSFQDALEKVAGNVKASHTETITGTYYLTEGAPFTMITSSVYSSVRYNDITVSEGSYAFLDDEGEVTVETAFEAQTFYDAKNFYQITDYEDEEWDDSKQTISRSYYSDVADVLNIDFPTTFMPTIELMVNAFGHMNFACECTGLNDFTETGDLSIKFTIFEDNLTTPSEIINYAASMEFDEDDFISAISTESEDALYAGGKKANWQKNFVDTDFVQGEFEQFEGKRFNPDDYED